MSLGPRSRVGNLWESLLEGGWACKAVVSYAYGEEMPFDCAGCDGPFGVCVASRNWSKNACSNCIYAGSEWLSTWRSDSDSGAENDEPPKPQRPGRKRSAPYSDDDYVPPKTRSQDGSRRPASKQHAGRGEHNFSPQKRQRRWPSEAEPMAPKLGRMSNDWMGLDRRLNDTDQIETRHTYAGGC
ncbi:hypothetical protein F5883DRAFT_597349 [Diaporthe sp. PMI_573]|nr:hypothetical protein F5883DRAFT_597349 [Diaporthaceae sp. PMI_573]